MTYKPYFDGKIAQVEFYGPECHEFEHALNTETIRAGAAGYSDETYRWSLHLGVCRWVCHRSGRNRGCLCGPLSVRGAAE